MSRISWAQVIALAERGNSLGDVEVENERCMTAPVKRGPLKSVFRHGTDIFFETLWTARKDHSGQGWRRLDQPIIKVCDELVAEIEDGTIVFVVPHTCRIKIFFKTHRGSRLDPSMVPDLTGDEVRQSRALEYMLPPSATWKQVVDKMRDWASDGGVSIEDQARVQNESSRFASA